MSKYAILLTFVFSAITGPTAAQNALLGWRSAIVFQPYHPWRDSAIMFPAPHGPIPVHVRVYTTPTLPPYYNVPPYIVLDP